MPRLAIALLGHPLIQLDGHPVETDRRKAIALLAYLAVAGQAQTREQLAALLWPDYERESAYAYLRRTLWELNQILGKGWVEADRDQVALLPTPDLWVDTAAFHELAHAGPDNIAALTEAANLYRGDFLAGFGVADTAPFEEWQLRQAEYFRRELARLLEQLTDAHLKARDHTAALPQARRWLTLDTLNEAAHRALMRLLAATGDRTAALRQYDSCVQTLKAELGIAPQPETTELYQTIRRGEASGQEAKSDRRSPAPRLPVFPTPFIGRRAEVEQIKALVQSPQHPLVTLTGPGGTGKTRLSIQVATEIADAFLDGAFFVPLAPLREAEALLPAVAKALGFSFYREEETPRQQLLDYLREKRLLLILDNIEHLLEVGELIAEVLAHAVGVKLIVTSRVRLNLPGEQLYPVGGMRLPRAGEAEGWEDPEEQAKPFSAVQLFLERAQRVRPKFALTKNNTRPVMEICRLVQGMPLALELAAAWVELLPPAEIATEISRNLDFLETEQAGVPDRQRSLRAVFESSWKLLNEREQMAFLRLCVFVGSFSREGAEHVSGASLRMLLGLANKSWLQQLDGGRFQLHELMRQYGEERLRADEANWREAKNRHADHFADFVAEQSQRMRGPEQLAGLKALEEEHANNVKAAWDWLVAERRWFPLIEKILPGLYQFGMIRSQIADMIQWLRPPRLALEAEARADERLALAILGTLEVAAEEAENIKDAKPIERLTALWQMVAEHHLAEPMGFWFVLLAGLVVARNVDQSADALLEKAVARIRQKGDAWLLAMSLLIQSNVGGYFSFDEAKILEAARIFERRGVLYEQGVVAEAQGRYAGFQKRPPAEVIHHYRRSQQFFEQVGNLYSSACNSILLSSVYLQQGQAEQMFTHFRQDERIMEQLGNTRLVGVLFQWESLYASRYSTFDHALAARQRALALALKAEVQSDIVWHYFELGEIYRVFGHLSQAIEFYEQARPGFEKMNLWLGLGFYERAHGDIALQASRYAEALVRYQAFLKYAQQDNHIWSVGQAHAKLALAYAYLQDHAQARSAMRYSLTEMQAWGQDELELLALLAECVCLLQEGRPTQAAELAAFIAHHPISWNETKQHARALLETAARNWPEETARAAIERGKELKLEYVREQMVKP